MTAGSFYRDMNGDSIGLFDEVNVPSPKPDGTDIWNYEFTGMVDSFRNGNVIVIDGDCDCFEIEPERLEVAE